ncbi:hypothetical protein WISP_01168 [Willisornis vidua]|uniref:Uncharacterized protein n=1 Tax=Willisornis vidua TaxID=1566151 RepID=A0ABQ9E0J4_9PASS|nr:hypothetical protein WISP_01168 [Willisornis vidua]
MRSYGLKLVGIRTIYRQSGNLDSNFTDLSVTVDARIQRHNYICQKLSEQDQKVGWVVYQEPRLRDKNNVLHKPDLTLVKEDKAYVVDVTVRYEFNTTYLDGAMIEKTSFV